ncbi:MAG: hypothetical protein PVH59_05200 [Anaerolineae bacterium]|jgi:hypothetical protein
MKRRHIWGVVLALGLLVVVMSAETAQTQEPTGNDPSVPQSGTAGIRPENLQAVSGVSSLQEGDAVSDLAAGYNATLRIPAAALKPRESNVEWSAGSDGGCAHAVSGDQYTWWVAPFYLPDGATLRYFRMYYNDQDVSVNCAAYLTVYDLYGRIVDEWGIFSSGTGQNYVTTAELDHQIDYSSYNYVINWSPNMIGSDMQVCGFRVYYEYNWGAALLPAVMNGN